MSATPAARDRVLDVVRERGLLLTDEPVRLASGRTSSAFVDAKAALARGEDLRLACGALAELVAGEEFDCVGGLTMGADHLAHGMAIVTGREWFVVRKEPKGRGTGRLVEGSAVGPGTRALVVEDVVTTGSSMMRAVEAVEALGGRVVAAVALVDRGGGARRLFEGRGLRFESLITHSDLGIDPVGDAPPGA